MTTHKFRIQNKCWGSHEARCHKCGQLYKSHDLYRDLFKELNKTIVSKVRIGNKQYIEVKGRGTIATEGHLGLKLIYDVLYVPELYQNLLSVAKLLEKGYKVLFKDKNM